ncbi:MAG: hypothetical protein ACOYMF_18060 [Bacteroidales bacterium]
MKAVTKIIGRIAFIIFAALSVCTISCKKNDNQSSYTDVASD